MKVLHGVDLLEGFAFTESIDVDETEAVAELLELAEALPTSVEGDKSVDTRSIEIKSEGSELSHSVDLLEGFAFTESIDVDETEAVAELLELAEALPTSVEGDKSVDTGSIEINSEGSELSHSVDLLEGFAFTESIDVDETEAVAELLELAEALSTSVEGDKPKPEGSELSHEQIEHGFPFEILYFVDMYFGDLNVYVKRCRSGQCFINCVSFEKS